MPPDMGAIFIYYKFRVSFGGLLETIALAERWRYCKHCMERTWFKVLGGKWFCETCGIEYGK